MSYRIHLSIIDKNKFNKATKNEKEWYKFYYNKFNGRRIELSDSLNLDQFKKIKTLKNEEYPPYVLTKNDFLKIIKFYRKEQIEITKNKLKQYGEIKQKETKEIDSKVANFLNGYFSFLFYIQNYFEMTDDNKLVHDSDYFLLQYFYLVELYKNTDFKNNAIVITHG